MAELVDPPRGSDGVETPHKHWRDTITDGNNTGIIYINSRSPVSLGLAPDTGVTAAYWEYTLTPRSVIADDADNAVWHKWPIGDVEEADGNKADAILAAVSAVRGSTAGGDCTFEVLTYDD